MPILHGKSEEPHFASPYMDFEATLCFPAIMIFMHYFKLLVLK